METRDQQCMDGAAGQAQAHVETRDSTVIPLVAERLTVEENLIETGRARIVMHIREREELVDEPLFREDVTIERVVGLAFTPTSPSSRLRSGCNSARSASPWNAAPLTVRPAKPTSTPSRKAPSRSRSARRGGRLQAAHVVEEVVVSKDSGERVETVRDTVRRTDVEVQPAGAGQTVTAGRDLTSELEEDEDVSTRREGAVRQRS